MPTPKLVEQRYELVAVDRLKPHPKNPNQGDRAAIAESIGENDFFGACLAQASTGLILIGEHRWREATKAGLKEVPVLWLDVDDDRARKIMLADNATRRGAKTREDVLAAVLKEIPDAHVGTGYSEDEVAQIIASCRPKLDFLDKLGEDLHFGGDDGEDMSGGVEPQPTVPGPAKAEGRHALPIVLTGAEKRTWDAFKTRVRTQNDKKAFLKLLEAAGRG